MYFHWAGDDETGSEHTINNQPFPAEVQVKQPFPAELQIHNLTFPAEVQVKINLSLLNYKYKATFPC